MNINSIKTHKIQYGDLLETVLNSYIVTLPERSVIAVTSKIISVIEGRYVDKKDTDIKQLIQQEADQILKTDKSLHNIYLTIKNGLLIPSAGIDESNVDDVYVLYPHDVWKTAEWIWQYLRAKHQIKELGVIITDSHTTIMRRGVTGIALSWCGFSPLYSYIGKLDLYGQPLKVTQINIVDSLAVAAVFVMGEGCEQTPMATITQAPHLTFVNRPPIKEERANMIISLEEDLYAPLLRSSQWE